MSQNPHAAKAVLTIAPAFTVGETDPRLFGSFIEQMGRAVYSGIYEPGHPTADEHGFRGDVQEQIRELRVPLIRYPGGNFVSGYLWEDGIGPKEQRPHRADFAWRAIETNEVGTDEFLQYCERMGVEPMMAVNLGLAGLQDAKNLVEYCNFSGGTAYSDLRRKNGREQPYGVKLWCLGNEMDGYWQIGHKEAHEYGRLAEEASKLMKWVDPTIETVLCGSSTDMLPTYLSWEQTVLEHAYDWVDYISLHQYLDNRAEDTPSYLAAPLTTEARIREVTAVCDFVQAKKRSRKKMMLSFDEWNVWYHTSDQPTEPWTVAPPILEERYSMEDALVAGGMLLALVRHCDRVKVGCLAQLVNIIAPIMTVKGGGVWRQTIFYPYRDVSVYGRGLVYDIRVDAPTYVCKQFGEVSAIDAVAVKNEAGELVIFAINRLEQEALPLEADLAALPVEGGYTVSHETMTADSPKDTNTPEQPDRVTPRMLSAPVLEDGRLHTVLPPLSWNMIRIK